jgi:hypothetical protein
MKECAPFGSDQIDNGHQKEIQIVAKITKETYL